MSGIFISYRREDRPGFAGRLAEALEQTFGEDRVFRDVEDIPPGQDFVEVIEDRLRNVDVLLAMIGPGWLGASRGGERRLEQADDFVRIEIASALASGKPVWPVLVDGAKMPVESDLPEPLRALSRRQAVILTEFGWKDDVARLVTALRPLVPVPESGRPSMPTGRTALVAGALAILCAITIAMLPGRTDAPRAPASDTGTARPDGTTSTRPDRPDLGGTWSASVRYDWGAEHRETLDLRTEGSDIRGTVSYLGLPRIIEQGEWLDAQQIRVITRTEAISGAETRALTHRYHGRIDGDRIRFTLETSGGQTSASPVEFVAMRNPVAGPAPGGQ